MPRFPDPRQAIARIQNIARGIKHKSNRALDAAITGGLRLGLRAGLMPKVRGLEHIRAAAGQPMVIVANHLSYYDGLMLAAFLPVRPAFAIDTGQYEKFRRNPLTRFLFSRLTMLPIDPARPQALKTLAKLAEAGTPVMIFPEGRLSQTGQVMQIFDGAASVAEAAGAQIVPVHLKGLHLLPFGSHRMQHHPRRLRPDVALTVLPAQKLAPTTGTARERRQQRLAQMEAIMQGLEVAALDPAPTLFDDLKRAAHHYGRKRVTLEDHQFQRLTYGQVLTAAEALGAELAKITKAGEHVGFFLPSSNGAAVSFWALQAYGRVPAMLNAGADAATLQSCLATAEVKTVVTSRAFVAAGKLEDKIKALEAAAKVVYLEDIKQHIGTAKKLAALARARKLWPRRAPRASGSDTAVVLFTSGSEGMPKGVVLSHANIRANIAQVLALAPITPADKVFNALPLFHAFGLGGGMIMPMLRGIPSFQYPSPLDSKNIPKAIYMSDATLMFATDTFLRLYARGTDSDADMSRLRMIFAGAEPLTSETADTYLTRFGVRIFEGYGMTKAAPVVAINLPGRDRKGSVGRLLPGIEQRLEPVADMDGAYRLFIRGPNIMQGYLRPENPGVLDKPQDGWHDTGDIVRIDGRGFVSIAGRAKRFAKIGGEMVSLDAIESLARAAAPAFEQAAILRQRDGMADEIVLYTTDAALKRDGLAQAAKEKGASTLGLPGNDNIRAVAEIPKLASGKTDYVSLKRLDSAFNTAAEKPAAPKTATAKGPRP